MFDPFTMPVITWAIPCIDNRREKPFPVYNRVYQLDWTALSESEAREVLDIIDDQDRITAPSPSEIDARVFTISREYLKPDLRMMKFRKHFIEVDKTNNKPANEEAARKIGRFTSVRLNIEYFEDETGRPISEYEMLQLISGNSQPVIMGNSNSVRMLGHSKPILENEWTTESANTLSQFLNVIERIYASAWYASSNTVSHEIKATPEKSGSICEKSTLLQAIFPNDEETLAVLAYIRQLHGVDRLFAKAAEMYVKHCGDERKRFWVQAELEQFRTTVDSPPCLFGIDCTRREIIQMFMYGAGLLHSTSNHGDDKKLAKLFEDYGRHRAVIVFNHCLLDICGAAVPTYHVVKHDYEYWIKEGGLSPSERTEIKTLFTSFQGDG